MKSNDNSVSADGIVKGSVTSDKIYRNTVSTHDRQMLELVKANVLAGEPLKARIMIARHINVQLFYKIFEALMVIVTEEGRTPNSLKSYILEMDKEMLKWITEHKSEEFSEEIKKIIW